MWTISKRSRALSLPTSEPLDGDPLIEKEGMMPVSAPHQYRFNSYSAFIFHLSVLFIYSIIFAIIVFVTLDHAPNHARRQLVYSPAQGAVSWETKFLDAPLKGSSIYVGDPKPEIDDAWGDLVRYANTRVQAEDLERINRTSVPLNDAEGGFLVNLNVFHHLHCLNKIRKQLYNDYYQDWHSPSAQLEHVNHCIEYLRQVVMCNADITMQTFDWIDDYRRPWPNFKIQHECKNWDALTDWAKEHSVPSLIGPIITHPVLGVSWREDDIH